LFYTVGEPDLASGEGRALMALTRSFKELVEKQAASDPAFA
jgi:hypothetical protein